MRILIREVRRTAGEGVEYRDRSFDGDVASVGRATDQTIQIQDRGVALSHAELRAAGRHLAVRAQGEEYLFVNGKRTRGARLQPGDQLEIGAYTLTLREGEGEHDYVVEVEAGRVDEAEAAFGSEFRQHLDQAMLSKRRLSWVLASLILIGFLVVPLGAFIDQATAVVMRDLPIPDDGLWDSGPLHPSHQLMGDDCTACHGQPFVMVTDESCIACHTAITHHVDTDVHDLPELEGQRCASCHKEHNEPSVLVRHDQELCASCHVDLEAVVEADVMLDDASDFDDDHPEFRLTMLVPDGEGDAVTWTEERHELGSPGLEERSNLKFPHDVHMDPQGIDGPAGEVVMACGDCHQPEAGGAYMQPVRMEQHCADCHALTFDDAAPDRELPHGEPDMVVRLLEEYYARQILMGREEVQGRPLRRARRPGQERMRYTPEQKAAVAQAEEQALETAEAIFERTTCATCHEVARTDEPGRESPWQVRPVRISQVWMPKAWFDHEAHASEDCARCHGAENSETAADVLMPDIESCRDCHGGAHATNKLPSTCIECHVFHLPGTELMKPEVRGAELPPRRSDLDAMREVRENPAMPVRPL